MLRLTWLSTVLALAFLIISCAAPIEKEVENRGRTKADEGVQRSAPAMVGSQTVANGRAADGSGAGGVQTASPPAPSLSQNPVPPVVDWAFTRARQHPEMLLQNLIGSAKSTIEAPVSRINKPEIVKTLTEAKKRGAVVRVLCDRQEIRSKAEAEALKTLKRAGIPVKQNRHKGSMNLKTVIVDGSAVATGLDFSERAVAVDDDVLLVVRDPIMAQAWKRQFDEMWEDRDNYEDVK
ncbi:hypothetical protein GTO91_03365 [Heliobacterium undosum]|uniref:phospholipase D n=1 Tax=Heliomicrobium undosum TaxID=121734 RepID=A0A845L4Q2_9FIRM|nr:phospholipase D-like domain-containing protein [Heliomicrobium undosum]MZP28748.1 hypothetical protein [Heliomicrobium undosum]